MGWERQSSWNGLGGAAECPGVRNGRQRGCAQDGGGVRLDHQQEEGRRRSGQTAP